MSSATVHSYYFTEVGLLLTYSNSSSSSRCCSYSMLNVYKCWLLVYCALLCK